MYNFDDNALGWWDYHNSQKLQLIESAVWPFDYRYQAGAEGNTNTDTFTRVDEEPSPDVETVLDLALPNGDLGPNAYEIIAFYSTASSEAIGTKDVLQLGTNIDITTYGLKDGDGVLVNHSYQFAHHAAETLPFYEDLRTQIGFVSTRDAEFCVEPSSSSLAAATSDDRIRGYAPPLRVLSEEDTTEAIARFSVVEAPLSDDQLLLLAENRAEAGQTRETGDLFHYDEEAEDESRVEQEEISLDVLIII